MNNINIDILKNNNNGSIDNNIIKKNFNPFLLSDLECYSSTSTTKTKNNKSKKDKNIIQSFRPAVIPNIIQSNTIPKNNSDLKYWEYGNSGLKIKNFNSVMGKNLAKLYYIDTEFQKLMKIHGFKISKIFDKNSNSTFDDVLGNSSLQCNSGSVILKLKTDKLVGNFKIVACGKTVFSKIKVLPNDFNKYKIPDFDTVINNLDNLKLIIKTTNVINLLDNFNVESDYSDFSLDFDNIKIKALDKINQYRKENKEKNLLKSNSNFAFFIKMYESHGKAFVIDGPSNLIYYITEYEDTKNKSISVNYYALSINDNWSLLSNSE